MTLTFDEYQALARRTQNNKLTPHERLEHALFGLCSEVGEIHSIYQKAYQGHTVDPVKVKDEMGDALWFLAELSDVLGLRLDAVARENIRKLMARYPDGFSEEHSVHRKI